jgi:hypothetical protein
MTEEEIESCVGGILVVPSDPMRPILHFPDLPPRTPPCCRASELA